MAFLAEGGSGNRKQTLASALNEVLASIVDYPSPNFVDKRHGALVFSHISS